jgi:hypothetical protein
MPEDFDEMMTVRNGEFPPMFEEIDAAFGIRGKPVVFCWGQFVFNPMCVGIGPDVLAHEEVHRGQQGDYIEDWWRYYIASPEFRLEQEVSAHRAQYRWWVDNGTGGRNQRRRALKWIAECLASATYGNLVSPAKARELILA